MARDKLDSLVGHPLRLSSPQHAAAATRGSETGAAQLARGCAREPSDPRRTKATVTKPPARRRGRRGLVAAFRREEPPAAGGRDVCLSGEGGTVTIQMSPLRSPGALPRWRVLRGICDRQRRVAVRARAAVQQWFSLVPPAPGFSASARLPPLFVGRGSSRRGRQQAIPAGRIVRGYRRPATAIVNRVTRVNFANFSNRIVPL